MKIIARGRIGQIEFDGQFVTIRRTRFISRILVGKGEKRIPITSITAMQFKPAGWIFLGFIQFTLPGGNEIRSQFGRNIINASRDENSVSFDFLKRKQFFKLSVAVQDAMLKQNASRTIVSAAASPSKLERLKQLGELRDTGVLTPKEFEIEKIKILSSDVVIPEKMKD